MSALSSASEAGGSLIGSWLARGDRKKSRDAIEKVNAEAGPSAFVGLEGDPAARDYQMRALDQLYSTGTSGGLDPASQARLRAASNQAAAATNGAQGAITQNYAMRGAGGGGSELAARLAAAQGGATAQAAAGTQAAGDASTRALSALSAAGGIAGQTRGQTWQEQSGKANAQDVMGRFNAGQRLDKGAMVSGIYDKEAKRKQDVAAGAGGLLGTVGGFLGRK
jgi:hypothetical protein